MKLTGGRIDRFLSNPPADIVGVLFFGPDRGLAKERSESLIKKFIDNPDDAFATTVLTADDLSTDPARLSDEMSALSLLGDDRLVRVRLDHERSGAAISKIIKNLDTDPSKAAAKLVMEAGDMTPRSAVRKAFEAAGHFAAIGCYADSAADLANLVRKNLTEHNIAIDADALDFWVPLLEGDRALSRGEIEKMILYKGYGTEPNAKVTLENVKAVASGAQAASIDDIIMSAMSGKVEACDDAFRRAVEGKVNTAVILLSLQRHISRLLEASSHMQAGERAEGAMKALRPPVFRMQERKFLSHLKIWPSSALNRALSQSLVAEEQLKSAGAPGEAIVGRMLLALSSYAARRA